MCHREFLDSREGFIGPDEADWADYEAYLDGRLEEFEAERANSELNDVAVMSQAVSGYVDSALAAGEVPTIPADWESLLI